MQLLDDDPESLGVTWFDSVDDIDRPFLPVLMRVSSRYLRVAFGPATFPYALVPSVSIRLVAVRDGNSWRLSVIHAAGGCVFLQSRVKPPLCARILSMARTSDPSANTAHRRRTVRPMYPPHYFSGLFPLHVFNLASVSLLSP